jgi:endonuclease/exonuclease/phosphatase family metal-dependent hydrolase
VLAQECRPPQDAPGERFRPEDGDTLLWSAAPERRWGSAIFLRRLRARPLPIRGFGGWVVGAEVSGPDGPDSPPLRVFSIHCPVGERGYIRTLHAILDRIARVRAGADLILGGDFNVVVGQRHPGERLTVSRGEREILERLAGEFDLISCWQACHPSRPLAQTLRWSADRIAPYHCDGIFVPSTWRARLAGCRVVTGTRWAGLSDHNPVLADFTVGPLPLPPRERVGVRVATERSRRSGP